MISRRQVDTTTVTLPPVNVGFTTSRLYASPRLYARPTPPTTATARNVDQGQKTGLQCLTQHSSSLINKISVNTSVIEILSYACNQQLTQLAILLVFFHCFSFHFILFPVVHFALNAF